MSQATIGISMLHCLGEPFNKMVKRLAAVEAPLIEVVDDGLHTLNKKRVATLNEAAKSKRLRYTVHAPFADINIASPSKPILNVTIKRLNQSLAFTNALNAQLWIFHPGCQTGISMFYPGKAWQQNIQSIRKLQATAEDYGVKIAIENLPEKYGFIMKNAEDFRKFYAETSLDIGIVLDVGHANLEGQAETFLKEHPTRIEHIHVSDNMGENDQHLGIGYGKINWQRFAENLRQIRYSKTLVIESVEHVEESLQKLRQLLA
jgi:sugar phosphate isomerase/epimerase